MKIKNLLFSLSLAGVCFQQASAQVSHPEPAFSTAARHVGDGVRSIGDSNRYVAEHDDIRPAEFVPEGDSYVSPAGALNLQMLAPTAHRATHQRSARSSNGMWLNTETLLWFSEQQNSPALVTTSAATVSPIAGAAGVTPQFGGPDGIDRGAILGYRFEAGKYINSDETVGIAGRAYGIFSNDESYSLTSDGSTSIGLPFYNQATGANDAFLVAFDNGTQLVSDGSVSARSDLDMVGAEGSLHLLLGRSQKHRSDLLVGYTFNQLKNSIGVTSRSVNRAVGDGIPDGTVFSTNDLFETANNFHGGHLGVLSTVTANRISLTTLAKVSFGAMRQTGAVRGFLNEELGGSTTTTAGGVYTQPSNIGTSSRDSFAFIPEMGIKLGYAVRENVNVSLGYTFMFWSNVALAGDQIDSTVNLIPGNTSGRPGPMFNEGTFWMQGLDFGLTIDL